jgi:hypothetical protein
MRLPALVLGIWRVRAPDGYGNRVGPKLFDAGKFRFGQAVDRRQIDADKPQDL